MDSISNTTAAAFFSPSPQPQQQSKPHPASKLISDEVQAYVELVLRVFLCGGVSFFGIVANIINVVVFIRQGLQEGATVCLLALSISDLGVCISIFVHAIGIVVHRLRPRLIVNVDDLKYLFGSLPRQYFGHLAMCTTMVMSVERCLCVIRPLTYKRIVKRRNTIIVLGILYAEVIAVALSQFTSHSLSWNFDREANRTRLMLISVNSARQSLITTVRYVLNTAIFSSFSMVIVTVCTGVMVAGLRSAKSFRKVATHNYQPQQPIKSVMTNRDARLVQLVTLVSIIFLVTYTPMVAKLVAGQFIPELNMYGFYQNLNDVIWGIIYFTGACNATFNIFVYYATSSNYRRLVGQLFLKVGSNGEARKFTVETATSKIKEGMTSMAMSYPPAE